MCDSQYRLEMTPVECTINHSAIMNNISMQFCAGANQRQTIFPEQNIHELRDSQCAIFNVQTILQSSKHFRFCFVLWVAC